MRSRLPVENGIWKINGKMIQDEGSAKYHIMNKALKSFLTVSSLNEEDEGMYTFSVENRIGRGQSNIVSFTIPNGKYLEIETLNRSKTELVTFFIRVSVVVHVYGDIILLKASFYSTWVI